MTRPRHTRLLYPTARKLFPADSEVAKWMMPALVLRADLWLEHHVVGADDEVHESLHGSNNKFDEYHSRMYFFRGTLRSLYSAKKVLQRLMGLDQFKSMLEVSGHRAEFNEAHRTVNRAAEEFEPLRNVIGGHVEEDVAEARSRIVTSGDKRDHFHRNHRGPGDHPVISGRFFARADSAPRPQG